MKSQMSAGIRVHLGAALLKCNVLSQEPVLPLLTLRCPEEILQFLEGFLGTFFLQKMATIETVPHGVFCPPEGENRRHDLIARTVIRFVHLETDTGRRSEILARGMNRRRAAEAATILAYYFGREGSRRLVQHAKVIFQIVLRIEPNEMFWERRRLDKEEPPHVFCRKLLIGLSIHRQRRSDVHETNLCDTFGKVEA
jgi:hypothetical protein